MAGDWKQDKEWTDLYIPQVKAIIGTHFIDVSNDKMDQEEGTDLIVLTLNPYRFGVRLRKNDYFESFKYDFTIRFDRPSGKKSEMKKIMSGWGDFIFYGFTKDHYINAYAIIDLKIFREEIIDYMTRNKGKIPGIKKYNKDNSSSFYIFKYKDFSDGLVIAAKGLGLNLI